MDYFVITDLTRIWPCWARLAWRLTVTWTPSSVQATVGSSGVGTRLVTCNEDTSDVRAEDNY